jgi:sec-independent protein translocase protein TatB
MNDSPHDAYANWGTADGLGNPGSAYQPPRKNWRLKRGATPLWFKQKQSVRRQVQSGAARVARFRPKSSANGH